MCWHLISALQQALYYHRVPKQNFVWPYCVITVSYALTVKKLKQVEKIYKCTKINCYEAIHYFIVSLLAATVKIEAGGGGALTSRLAVLARSLCGIFQSKITCSFFLWKNILPAAQWVSTNLHMVKTMIGDVCHYFLKTVV